MNRLFFAFYITHLLFRHDRGMNREALFTDLAETVFAVGLENETYYFSYEIIEFFAGRKI